MASNDTSSTLPGLTEGSLHTIRDLQTYEAAVFGMAVWDIIITISEEYRYVWKQKPLTFLNGVYFLNRYLILVFGSLCVWMSNNYLPNCDDVKWIMILNFILFPFLCSIILSTRVYAIYDRQKWMIPFFSALVMGMVAIYVVTEVGVTTVSLPPPATLCRARTSSNIRPLYFAYLAFFYCLVFLFSSWRCLKIWREARERSKTSLFAIVVREGLPYISFIVAANLLNAFWFGFKKGDDRALHVPFATYMTSVMCWRLTLDLRHQSAAQSSIITSASLPQPSLPTELKGAEIGSQEDTAVRSDILINFPDMFWQASKTTGTAHGNSDLERNAHGVDEIRVASPVQDDGSTDPRPQ